MNPHEIAMFSTLQEFFPKAKVEVYQLADSKNEPDYLCVDSVDTRIHFECKEKNLAFKWRVTEIHVEPKAILQGNSQNYGFSLKNSKKTWYDDPTDAFDKFKPTRDSMDFWTESA